MAILDRASLSPRPHSGRKGYNEPAQPTPNPPANHLSPSADDRGRRGPTGRKRYNGAVAARNDSAFSSPRSSSHSPSPSPRFHSPCYSASSRSPSSHSSLTARRGCKTEPQEPKPAPDPSGRKGYNNHNNHNHNASHQHSSQGHVSPARDAHSSHHSHSLQPQPQPRQVHAGLIGRKGYSVDHTATTTVAAAAAAASRDNTPSPRYSPRMGLRGRKGYNGEGSPDWNHRQMMSDEGAAERHPSPLGLGISAVEGLARKGLRGNPSQSPSRR